MSCLLLSCCWSFVVGCSRGCCWGHLGVFGGLWRSAVYLLTEIQLENFGADYSNFYNNLLVC